MRYYFKEWEVFLHSPWSRISGSLDSCGKYAWEDSFRCAHLSPKAYFNTLPIIHWSYSTTHIRTLKPKPQGIHHIQSCNLCPSSESLCRSGLVFLVLLCPVLVPKGPTGLLPARDVAHYDLQAGLLFLILSETHSNPAYRSSFFCQLTFWAILSIWV